MAPVYEQTTITVQAAERLAEHSAVFADAAGRARQCRSGRDPVLGVTQRSAFQWTGKDARGEADADAIADTTAPGEELGLIISGLAFPLAGARVRCGEFCVADARGYVVPAALIGEWAVGRALETVEAGQPLDLLVAPQPLTAAHLALSAASSASVAAPSHPTTAAPAMKEKK